MIGWSHALKELRRAPELIAAAAQEALPRERGAKIYYNRDEIGRRFQHRDHHHRHDQKQIALSFRKKLRNNIWHTR